MPSSFAAAAAFLGALLLSRGSRALDVDWDIPSDRRPHAPATATVGATVRFEYAPGHNVVLHPTGTCDASGATRLGGTSPTEYVFDAAGTYTFACDVSGGAHCRLGASLDRLGRVRAAAPASQQNSQRLESVSHDESE